jgi:competence ComEA-like helix-hairpin-helix protein
MALFTSIQKHTGLARGEAVVVSTITALLVAGWIGQRMFPTSTTHDVATVERVIALLDTLSAHSTQPQTTNHQPQTSNHQPQTTPHQPKAVSKVRINTASRSLLEQLPGIGPAMAERIIEERSRAPFGSVDDLTRVKGIGPKKLEKMRPYVIAP